MLALEVKSQNAVEVDLHSFHFFDPREVLN